MSTSQADTELFVSLPPVSVIICTLNEEGSLPAVLTRLPPFVSEVILVDGHSRDRTVEVARELNQLSGVRDVAVVMATEANLALLEHAGLLDPDMEKATANDLIIAIRADSDEITEQALAAAGERRCFAAAHSTRRSAQQHRGQPGDHFRGRTVCRCRGVGGAPEWTARLAVQRQRVYRGRSDPEAIRG